MEFNLKTLLAIMATGFDYRGYWFTVVQTYNAIEVTLTSAMLNKNVRLK